MIIRSVDLNTKFLCPRARAKPKWLVEDVPTF